MTLAAMTCGAALLVPAAFAAGPTVRLSGESFSPKTVSVGKGGSVTFRWRSGTHNVRFARAAGVRNIGTRSSGSRSRKFNRRGSFRIVCTIHDGMTGRVRVR